MKLSMAVVSGLLCCVMANGAEGQALTPKSLDAALTARPGGAEAEQLAGGFVNISAGRTAC
jgi:hypothetical protein